MIISSLHDYSSPFSSSSNELDGESILDNLEADTSTIVGNPSFSTDGESMRSNSQQCITYEQ